MAATKSRLSTEEEILVLTARVHLDPAHLSRLQALLENGPDLEMLLKCAGAFRTGPLLYRHIIESGIVPGPPPAVCDRLLEEYRLTALNNLRIHGLVRQALGELSKLGESVILLKGAFLARWIYPDFSLRPIGDLDILACPESRYVVQRKFIEMGFQTDAGSFHSPLHEKILVDHLCSHLPALRNSRQFKVEVHSTVFRSEGDHSALLEELWRDRLSLDWDGLPVSALSPEFQVFHLCTHLCKHIATGGFRLIWLCDIHETIGHYTASMDWKKLLRIAGRAGAETELNGILSILRTWWNSPIPDGIGIAAGKDEIPFVEVLREQCAGDPARSRMARLQGFSKVVRLAAHGENRKERLAYFIRLVFPTRENMFYRYNPKNKITFLLLYVAHPFTRIARILESLYYYWVDKYRRL